MSPHDELSRLAWSILADSGPMPRGAAQVVPLRPWCSRCNARPAVSRDGLCAGCEELRLDWQADAEGEPAA